MVEASDDLGRAFVLDGNAAGGLLQEVFGIEMTDNVGCCAHCGQNSMLGSLHAYGQAMGTVLRCPHCEEVMLRIVKQPEAVLLDMQGVAYLRFERTPTS